MVGRVLPWCLLAVLWAITGSALLNTTQGTYEDAFFVNSLINQPPPPILTPRGLSRWTLWYQINTHLTPVAIRVVNLELHLLVAGLVGLLASQFGFSPWMAVGIMLLHPLAVETVATMSGRGELVSAVGVLFACVMAMATSPWKWIGVAAGLGLSIAGKESGIVGLACVPLLLSVRDRRWRVVALIAALVIIVGAWQTRSATLPSGPSTPLQPWATWAGLQAVAAWRLIVMTVLPIGQTVDFDYDGLARIWTWAASLCLSSVAYLAWQLRQGNALMATCLTWMLLVCAPRLIVQTPKSYFNEHQMYLALPAFALLVCALMQKVSGESCSPA